MYADIEEANLRARRAPSSSHNGARPKAGSRRRRGSVSSVASSRSAASAGRGRGSGRKRRSRARSTSSDRSRSRSVSRSSSRSRVSPSRSTSPPIADARRREDELQAKLKSRRESRRSERPSDRSHSSRSHRSRSRSRSPSPTKSIGSLSSRRDSRHEVSRDEERSRRRRGGVDGPDEAHDRTGRRSRGDNGERDSNRRNMYDDEYEARRSSYRASRERDDYYYPTRGGGGDRRDPYRDSRYGPPRSSYYDRDPYYYAPPPPPSARRGGYEDERRRDYRSASPRRGTSARKPVTPEPEDYELRSIFCSQLAARLGERDLGEFLEEKLGDGSVRDIRIVTDRTTGRSKGIGYVELKHEELVPKAIALTGEKLFGIPIIIQRTEAARNRGEGASTAEAPIRPNLPQPLPILDPDILTKLPLPGLIGMNGATAPILPLAVAGAPAKVSLRTPTVIHANTAARLYVGSLHFNLTAEDVKSVFAPFGEIEYVDLHTEPGTNKSKGFAFVQFKQADDAEKAIQNMNGFELAGRNIKVSHVNAHSRERGDGGGGGGGAGARPPSDSGNQATRTSAYDEGGGAGLSANNRVALMEKLARIDSSSSSQPPAQQQRPATIPQASSKAVLLSNMFDPAEETERDWDVDLGQEVREECEEKYGKVDAVKVDRDSAGEIWLRFSEVDGASKAIAGLNGRFFGGRSITAQFVSESIMSAKFG